MPKQKTTGRINVSKGVSFEPAFIERMEARAKELDMNFSQFVRYCLEKEASGPVVLIPKKITSKPATARKQDPKP